MQCQNEWAGSSFVGPSFQQHVLVVQMDLMGETMTGWVWERQGPWECPATSAQFFYKHKTVLKIKLIKKQEKNLRFRFICSIYSQTPQIESHNDLWDTQVIMACDTQVSSSSTVQLSITLGLTSQQKHLLFKAGETGVRWSVFIVNLMGLRITKETHLCVWGSFQRGATEKGRMRLGSELKMKRGETELSTSFHLSLLHCRCAMTSNCICNICNILNWPESKQTFSP